MKHDTEASKINRQLDADHYWQQYWQLDRQLVVQLKVQINGGLRAQLVDLLDRHFNEQISRQLYVQLNDQIGKFFIPKEDR